MDLPGAREGGDGEEVFGRIQQEGLSWEQCVG